LLAVELLQLGIICLWHRLVEPRDVVGMMHGEDGLHAAPTDRVREQPDEIQLRSHVLRIPGIDPARPHREAVVVLGDRTGEPGTRIGEQRGPFLGVEMASLGFQLRRELYEPTALVFVPDDEVVIRPRRHVAIVLHVVLVLGRSCNIHVAGIPLVGEGRNRVDAPVEVDAEFGVLEPFGDGFCLL
jgi:hypothetical protein